jgi:hypothetical protein
MMGTLALRRLQFGIQLGHQQSELLLEGGYHPDAHVTLPFAAGPSILALRTLTLPSIM